ncbi:MAG: ABC transporter permease [Chloroflexota bacterium]
MTNGGNPFDFLLYISSHSHQFQTALSQHIHLTVVSVLVAIAIAVPLGIVATRIGILARPLTFLAGIGQTIPSLAILGLVLPWLGIGFTPSLFALTIRAILPIFLNTYIGIRSVEAAVIDASRGMGANNAQRLFLVELPLASPVIYAGIQTATVQTIGVATLAAFIGGGGLGDLILQGLALVDMPTLLAGAIPVALLAIAADIVLGQLRRFVIPRAFRLGAA